MVNSKVSKKSVSLPRKFRILDLINTDKSASELLDYRVAQINSGGVYENAIYCTDGEYVDRLRAKGHVVHVVNTPRGLSPRALVSSIWRTYRFLRKHKFDIIHTHGSVIGLIGRVAAIPARTPAVVHQVHGFHHHDAMNPLKQWVFIKVEQIFSLLTDRLLFQNKADIEECIHRRIAPAEKIVLIGNGIQVARFDCERKPDNNPKVILCVARFEPVKNHLLLLEAVSILKERGASFVVQLVGNGELSETYKSWVNYHGLQNIVDFLGYRDDVPSLTARADICVLPSVKEGLSRAIMEAAAAGRPMIATDVVGNRDALIDGKTGFLVPLNDPVALADKLELLLSDAALRSRLGQEARRYALEHFDERVAIDNILSVYNEITRNLR